MAKLFIHFCLILKFVQLYKGCPKRKYEVFPWETLYWSIFLIRIPSFFLTKKIVVWLVGWSVCRYLVKGREFTSMLLSVVTNLCLESDFLEHVVVEVVLQGGELLLSTTLAGVRKILPKDGLFLIL